MQSCAGETHVGRKSGGFCNRRKGRRRYNFSRRANRDAKVINLSVHDVINPTVNENIMNGFWGARASCDSGGVFSARFQ
jgi:hypothetical protein